MTYVNFTLAGDYAVIANTENGDGIVNIFDLVIAASPFSKTSTGIMGDVNVDEAVSIFDLVIAASHWRLLL